MKNSKENKALVENSSPTGFVDELKAAIANLSDEDLSESYTYLNNPFWVVALKFTGSDKSDARRNINMLLQNRPELLTNVLTCKNAKEFRHRIELLSEWLSYRNYAVGVKGTNFWSNIRLNLLYRLGI